jgi:hypothetical protein
MSDAATGALPEGEVVSISKAHLEKLARATDLMLAMFADGYVSEDELAEWGLSQERDATDEDREALGDPDLETVVEPSDELDAAMAAAADLTGFDPTTIVLVEPEPKLADA